MANNRKIYQVPRKQLYFKMDNKTAREIINKQIGEDFPAKPGISLAKPGIPQPSLTSPPPECGALCNKHSKRSYAKSHLRVERPKC